jgi:hypothetical protein
MTHAPNPADPFCVRFGSPPRLADGIHLRVWRSGPLAGQPKVMIFP